MVSIEQRPEIVDTKERFGDWEIDTIVGENNKVAIVIIVERKTAFTIMKKFKHGKNAKDLKQLYDYYMHTAIMYTQLQAITEMNLQTI